MFCLPAKGRQQTYYLALSCASAELPDEIQQHMTFTRVVHFSRLAYENK